VTDRNGRYVERAKRIVRDKFPEMSGVEPSLSKKGARKRVANAATSKDPGRPDCYVLTFERDVSLPGGGSLKRMVRVTMDESGEVVKLTSSK